MCTCSHRTLFDFYYEQHSLKKILANANKFYWGNKNENFKESYFILKLSKGKKALEKKKFELALMLTRALIFFLVISREI